MMQQSHDYMSGLESLNCDIPYLDEEGRIYLQNVSYEGIGEQDPFGRDDRKVAVSCIGYRSMRRLRIWDGCVARIPPFRCLCPSGDFFGVGKCFPRIEFIFKIRYQRYEWTIMRTYQKMKAFLRALRYQDYLNLSAEVMANLRVAVETRFVTLFLICGCAQSPRETYLRRRAENMCNIIQYIVDTPQLWTCPLVREFLEIGPNSFDPFYGEKGPEGYLWKVSGGYDAGFSRSAGDYVRLGSRRWVSFSPSQITWYRSHLSDSGDVVGTLKVTPNTVFYLDKPATCSFDTPIKRRLIIYNPIRSLEIVFWDRSDADRWLLRVLEFYKKCSLKDEKERQGTRAIPASFTPRLRTDVRLYHVPSDYFAAAAIALLGAKREIFIASWKNTPRVLLTRPPLPPLRLDQILAYKAAQGVKVYVLLYKEVEMSGQGNDSAPAKQYLEALSPEGNIIVVRHPNKIIGGSTAIWWSHHEKLTVVDRNLAFVGGIDLSVGRWDDSEKFLDDEDGLKYVDKDYRQPAEKMYNPARTKTKPAHRGRGGIGRLGKQVHKALGTVVDTVTEFTATLQKAASDTIVTPSAKSTVATEVLELGGEEEDERGMGEGDGGSGVDSNMGTLISSPGDDKSETERASDNQSLQDDGSRSVESPVVLECRDQFPRSGWHDVHTSLSGEAAQDVANHFVERWNHHRLSTTDVTGTGSLPILPYSTPHTTFGKCAKCDAGNVHEIHTYCQNCGHDLGAICPLVKPPTPKQIPLSLSPHTSGDYTPGMGSTRELAKTDSLSEAEKRDDEVLSETRRDESVRSYIEYKFVAEEGFCVPILGSQPVVVLNSESFNYVNKASLGVASSVRVHADSTITNSSLGSASHGGEYEGKVKIPPFLCSSSTLFVPEGDRASLVDGLENVSPTARVKSGKLPFPTMAPSCGKGELLYAHGVNSQILQKRGLVPLLGDVVASINGVDVSHMDHRALARFFHRLVNGWSKYSQPIVVEGEAGDSSREVSRNSLEIVLRRHYVENFADAVGHESAGMGSTADNPMLSATEIDDEVASTREIVMQRYRRQINSAVLAARADWEEARTLFGKEVQGNIKHGYTFVVNASSYLYNRAKGHDAETSQEERNKRQVDTDGTLTSCVQSAGREIALQMSKLYAQEGTRAWLLASFPRLILPHVPLNQTSLSLPLIARNSSQSGSCCVQVLRSAGTWSLGIRTSREQSIHDAWCDAITCSKHFVYIENQFFIGCTKFREEKSSSDLPNNSIPAAILERIVRAARGNENFRIIVVIPQHPQGDIAYSLRPKSILHYQAETISKGPNSLYSRFRKLCPGRDPSEYLNFYCLQNYGIINNFFMHDQIYVHDKVCIVDDEVMIVGSANVNDRSMLGDRDTEVAIRVEDYKKEKIVLGGEEVTVGCKPHEARLRLMRMHIGDKEGSINLDDILSTQVFHDVWNKVAETNASLYHAVDGDKSIYAESVKRFDTYHHALENYVNPSVTDRNVVAAIGNLQGFLIPYPHSFLSEEDLKPGLVSAIVPEILWV